MYITDYRKHIITEPKRILGLWLGHYKHLLNIQHEIIWKHDGSDSKRGCAAHYHRAIRISGSSEEMKKMQNNKACGPDGVPTYILRLLDKIL